MSDAFVLLRLAGSIVVYTLCIHLLSPFLSWQLRHELSTQPTFTAFYILLALYTHSRLLTPCRLPTRVHAICFAAECLLTITSCLGLILNTILAGPIPSHLVWYCVSAAGFQVRLQVS